MKNKPPVGDNLTGAALAPERIKMMLNAEIKFPPDIPGSDKEIEAFRAKIVREFNEPIGSIPLPVSVKGAVKNTFAKMLGKNPEIFLDKLGERLAFERTGVRLYECALAKAIGLNESHLILEKLTHIRNEEAEHMEMLKSTIEELGGDPTSMTPCADITGVMGMGLIQVISDPRTDITQVLNTLLNAELIDNAAWELLIDLANTNGQTQYVAGFQKALVQEQEHLLIIQNFLKNSLEIGDKIRIPEELAYHVRANENGGWDIKREQASRITRHFKTKKEALEVARQMSKKAGVKLFIDPRD